MATVTVNAANLNNGDFAGLSAFQGDYAFVGITKENNGLFAVMMSNTSKGGTWDRGEEEGLVEEKTAINDDSINVRIECDFSKDQATCYVENKAGFVQIGTPHDLHFRLDHFTGVRFALSCFSTEKTGGTAVFNRFEYSVTR